MVKKNSARIKPNIGKKLARRARLILATTSDKITNFFSSLKERLAKLFSAGPRLDKKLAPKGKSTLATAPDKVKNLFSTVKTKWDKLDSAPNVSKKDEIDLESVSLIPSKFKVMAKKVFAGAMITFLLATLIYIRPVYPYLTAIKKVKAMVVLSGSMLPTIKVGSVVVVAPPKNASKGQPLYKQGEIMTYTTGYETFTHRVVYSKENAGTFFYKTKGDNNKDEDIGEIPEYKTVGKVILYVPILGRIVNFVKSQQGFIALIIIPTTIIVYSEILNIKKELTKLILAKRAQSEAKA